DGTDEGAGPPCGTVPGDEEAVAASRAAADEACDCSSATSHGDYVSCVAAVTDQAVTDGSLREECAEVVMGCAAQSTCGRAGAGGGGRRGAGRGGYPAAARTPREIGRVA